MSLRKNYNSILVLCLLAFMVACGNKESDPNKIIAGETSKKWKADKETNAAGEEEKLTEAEKNEVMEFFNNGSFTISGNGASSQGSWSYNDAAKNLALQFANETVTENFAVLELEDDKIKLKAADGSTTVLDAEK